MAKLSELTNERIAQLMEEYGDIKTIKSEIKDWDAEDINKGYGVFDFDNLGILEINRFDYWMFFESDEQAVEQAIKDGVKIIPVDELPETFGRRYLGWIDTPENRRKIAEYAEKYPYDSLV